MPPSRCWRGRRLVGETGHHGVHELVLEGFRHFGMRKSVRRYLGKPLGGRTQAHQPSHVHGVWIHKAGQRCSGQLAARQRVTRRGQILDWQGQSCPTASVPAANVPGRTCAGYYDRLRRRVHSTVLGGGLVRISQEYDAPSLRTYHGMGHARQILASVLHRQFVELDMHQLSAETAFGSNKHLYCCATDGGLIGNRIVETENSASGHAEHHHWDGTRCRTARLAPDAIDLRGNSVRMITKWLR